MQLMISAAVLAAILLILKCRLPVSFLSPVYALIGVYILMFGVGPLVYDPAYGGSGANLAVSDAESYSLLVQVTWLLSAFTTGSLAFAFASRYQLKQGRLSVAPQKSRQLSHRQVQVVLLFGIITLAFVVGGHGVANVYWRASYITESDHTVKIIAGALLPVATLGFGAASTHRNSTYRFASIILAAGALFISLAVCSRLFCLMPALFFAGALITTTKRKPIEIALVLAIAAAPLLIVVPVKGREMPEQGLSTLPYLIGELSRLDPQKTLHEVVNNVFISEPLTIVSMQANVGDALGYAVMEVSPLPGFMTDWQSAQLRINKATPFNAVGDLLRAGIIPAACYFAVIGFYFARIDHKLRRIRRPTPSLICFIAFSYLFVLMTLQYPLRNSTRLIYYTLAFDTVATVAQRVRNTMRQQKVNRSTRVGGLTRLRSTPAFVALENRTHSAWTR